jgi:phage FluMu protein Com
MENKIVSGFGFEDRENNTLRESFTAINDLELTKAKYNISSVFKNSFVNLFDFEKSLVDSLDRLDKDSLDSFAIKEVLEDIQNCLEAFRLTDRAIAMRLLELKNPRCKEYNPIKLANFVYHTTGERCLNINDLSVLSIESMILDNLDDEDLLSVLFLTEIDEHQNDLNELLSNSRYIFAKDPIDYSSLRDLL